MTNQFCVNLFYETQAEVHCEVFTYIGHPKFQSNIIINYQNIHYQDKKFFFNCNFIFLPIVLTPDKLKTVGIFATQYLNSFSSYKQNIVVTSKIVKSKITVFKQHSDFFQHF